VISDKYLILSDMKKNVLNWMLMAVLVCGFSWSITACSDDDDDNKSEKRNEDASSMDTEDAQVAWRWLCALTDAQTLSEDWAKKTYSPTIGIASENNKLNRLVVVADIDEARMNFADLADIEVDKLATSQTINVKGVGKMTWTPSPANAQNLAEVIVDTKLIPNLQKIVYCTSDQTGLNGLFSTNITGTAYYRFGDVIKDGEGYYWVCVRPAHEVNDKGDSHWINIFNAKAGAGITSDNIYKDYDKKYNNKTILFPTKLKYKREHIYNLGNLIFALLNPDKYHSTVGEGKNSSGLGGFPYERHSEQFLNNVNKCWSKTVDRGKNMWQILFNTSKEDLEKLNSLNFYYQGYSWWVGSSATLWCYSQEKYLTKIQGSESGDKISWPVKEKGFDIRRYDFHENADIDAGHPQIDSNKGYWVIRYATGETLATNGKYTPVSQIPGCEDIYRYYHNFAEVAPGTTWENAKKYDETIKNIDSENLLGSVYGLDRHFYKSYWEAQRASEEPMALMVYRGGSVNSVDESTGMFVLGISLHKAWKQFSWSDHTDKICYYSVTEEDKDYYSMLLKTINGIAATKTLAAEGELKHSAAYECLNLMSNTLEEKKWNPADMSVSSTDWFLPSAGQWAMALQGMGVWDNRTNGKEVIEKITKFYDDAGIPDYCRILMDGSGMWTSTECGKDKAWALYIDSYNGIYFKAVSKTEKLYSFPFLVSGR